MSIIELALRNIYGLRRRFMGLAILVVVLVSLYASAATIADSANAHANASIGESVANRSITVTKAAAGPSDRKLGSAAVQEIRALPNVVAVEPTTQVSFGYKDSQVPGVLLIATMPRSNMLPPMFSGTRSNVFPLRSGEIILPANAQGMDLTVLRGKSISVQLTESTGMNQGTGVTRVVTVVGFYDPSWQLDGAGAAYADEGTVIEWAALRAGLVANQFVDTVGFDRLTVIARSSDDVSGVLAAVQGQGYTAVSFQQEASALPGVLVLVKTIVGYLLVVLALVALWSAYTVTSTLTRIRKREVGILKAVGLTRLLILGTLLLELVIVGAISALVGIVVGLGVMNVLAGLLRQQEGIAHYLPTGVLIPEGTTVGVSVLVVVCVLVVGALYPAGKAALRSPADAIMDVV
jgi:putative ABC transport system permease protein